MCLEDYLPKKGTERRIYEKVLAGEEISKEEAKAIGTDGDNHGDFPYKYAFMREDAIGTNGNHSVVFSVSPRALELVVKIPRYPKLWNKVERGEKMQTTAYNLKLKVAKPEGIYKVFNLDKKKFNSGFVMEHLGMLPINQIRSLKEQICENKDNFDFDYNGLMAKLKNSCFGPEDLHNKALREYEIAGDEAEIKGFRNIDYRETNAFWVPEIDDIRIIDCDEWDYLAPKDKITS
ncbi:MAG: hypothetical protein Q8Q04_01625 [archaeon]|nr:hypothetical protein [archaeon]